MFDTLAVSADFQCLLSEYVIKAGQYGLKIEVDIKPTDEETNKVIRKIGFLDSTDMFGDPYSFLIFSKQEKKFDISYAGTIQEIRLYLYQNNQFTHQIGTKIERLPKTEIPNYNNININNINITIGFDVTKIPDNEVKIYTGAPSEYINTNSTDITNKKEISLLWCNKDENHKYLGFSDGYYGQVSFNGKVTDYDEIQYLELVEKDNRLKRQIGSAPTDEIGLRLAADFNDISLLTVKVKTGLNELKKHFARYWADVSNAGFPEERFGKISLQSGNIDSIVKTFNDTFDV